jgi:flagellar motor protein MotB
MKTKVNLFGMSFDWRVLAGLAAVGFGIAVFAPKLALGALPLLLLAACPLSMFLMMVTMNGKGEGSASSTRRQLKGTTASSALSREEQVAQLREQLQNLQQQQEAIASQINTLEQTQRQSAFGKVRPKIKHNYN